jgi:hypothetical protein
MKAKLALSSLTLIISMTISAQSEVRRTVHNLPIPKTIEECFELLDQTMSENEIQLIKDLQEDSIYYHKKFNYRADFFHAWKLYGGSILTEYFNKKGLHGSYEIYNTILVSYHRYLNNREIKLDDQINKYKLKQEEEKKVHEQKLQKDTINGVYIPKNLEDCFIQLDKLLSDEDKQYIKQLKDRKETIELHFGLGTWIRNNWGVWGGSRLQKYMLDRENVGHPDGMSAIILEFYYDWLNGKNDEWRKFDKK